MFEALTLKVNLNPLNCSDQSKIIFSGCLNTFSTTHMFINFQVCYIKSGEINYLVQLGFQFSCVDDRFLNTNNYRQASAVVVVVAAAAAGHLAADHTNGLPHQPVHRHVPVRRPSPSNPFRNALVVGRRFRQLQINNDKN